MQQIIFKLTLILLGISLNHSSFCQKEKAVIIRPPKGQIIKRPPSEKVDVESNIASNQYLVLEKAYNSFVDTLSKYHSVLSNKYQELNNNYTNLRASLIRQNQNDPRITALDSEFKKISITIVLHDTIKPTYQTIKLAPPYIDLPLPVASAREEVKSDIFNLETTYSQINDTLESYLKKANINELRYFLLKEDDKNIGFSIMTPLERIDPEGAHVNYFHAATNDFYNFSLANLFKNLKAIWNKVTFQNVSFIRTFLFTVTNNNTVLTDNQKPKLDSLDNLYKWGTNFSSLGLSQDVLDDYSVNILVYEFKKVQYSDTITLVEPLRLDLKTHLRFFKLDKICK